MDSAAPPSTADAVKSVTFQLRQYQLDLVNRCDDLLLNGETPCLVAVTGAGKTVMIAELAKRWLDRGEKVLAVCHRQEILRQLCDSLQRHLAIRPQVISAQRTTAHKAPVAVAMVPTLTRRPRAVAGLQGRLYLTDEGHHGVAPSWQRLKERLNPLATCGFTATPITPTGSGLAAAGFTELVIGPEPRWLMDNGFLCDYKLYGAPAEIDTEGIAVRAGDFAIDQLEQRVVEVEGSVIRDWRKFNPEGFSTICVGVSVEHAHRLAALYRQAGISAATVDGSTPMAERDETFNRFRSGELTVLCACAVVDEGLDVPSATCLQLLRPTRSIRLYRQLVGRVLRPSPGKEHAIILDHSGTWRSLPLPDDPIEWSLKEKVKRIPAADRQVSRDDDTYEVKQREVVAVEDHRPMVLVNREQRVEALKHEARKRFRKNLALVHRGIIPRQALKGHMRDARWLSMEELLALQNAAGLASNWAEQQRWLTEVGM